MIDFENPNFVPGGSHVDASPGGPGSPGGASDVGLAGDEATAAAAAAASSPKPQGSNFESPAKNVLGKKHCDNLIPWQCVGMAKVSQ